jgi:hypothetical protein
MKLAAILITTVSLIAVPPAGALYPPQNGEAAVCDEHQPESKGDACCPTSAPAAPVRTVAHQQPQTVASPGNKFPLPAAAPRQQAQRTGSIAVRATQGTPGAEAIGSVPISIELYHRGTLIDTLDAHLDEHGVALIEDLPVSMGFQPLVKVFYSGVTYQKVGHIMDPTRSQQMIDIVCYELTEVPPPWKKRMRHAMIGLAPDGIQVTEVIAVHNPTERTWTGTPPAPATGGEEEKAVSTQFLIPPGAIQVTLGDGFHDWCCSTLGDDRIMNHIPLVPGTTEMIFAYYLPARRGAVTLELNSLTDVDHLMVIVPESLTMSSYSGITATGQDNINNNPVQLYTGTNMSAGQPVRMVLTGLNASESVAAGTIAKIVAGAGGGLILIIAGYLIFSRSPNRAAPAAAASRPASEDEAEPRTPAVETANRPEALAAH